MVIAANMAVETCKLIRIDLKHSHHKREHYLCQLCEVVDLYLS